MVSTRREYEALRDSQLSQIVPRLEQHLVDLVADLPFIDRVSVRAKSIESFVNKAERKNLDGTKKYEYPFDQILDMIGARIVVLFEPMVSHVIERADKFFTLAESQFKEPQSENEFGYYGYHSLLLIPSELIPDPTFDNLPEVFELQVKTVHQHAWSEASHDLAYKEGTPLTSDQKRRVAYAAASAWGADQIFSQLALELRALPND